MVAAVLPSGSGDVNTDWDDRDALKHGGSSMTISFQTTGFEPGWTWGQEHMAVGVYFPFVSLSGSGTAIEDGSENATFTASRSGGGTVLEEPLTVLLKDAGGSARPGADYTPPGSITIPGNQTDGSKQVDAINDDEAEGLVEIFLSVKPQGSLYALAAPPTTAPATNATTAKANKDDDVSVKSIKVLLANPPAGQPGVLNAYYGYNFYIRFSIEGEHLDLVDIRQDVWSRTRMWDTTGQEFAAADVLTTVRAYPGNANAPEALVNTNGEFVLDPSPGGAGWDWHPMPVDANSKDGTSNSQGDAQTFAINTSDSQIPDGAGGTIHYTYLVSRDMAFNFRTKDRRSNATGPDLKDFQWSYNWTNDPCKWMNGDIPAPPAGVQVAAASHKNNGKGRLSGSLEGLDALN
jgi:hypothetical protein